MDPAAVADGGDGAAALDAFYRRVGLGEGAADRAVPPRFLAAEKGDEHKALARWHRTLEWRHEHRVDTLLEVR